MKTVRNLMVILTVVATLGGASLFADSRHRERTDGYRGDRHFTTVEGRIRDIDRERNGFVIRLDRGGYVLFAEGDTRVDSISGRDRRARVRQLERGDYVRVSGRIDGRRMLHVQHITLVREEDDRRDRNDAYLSGIVQSVDRRQGIIWVEEARSRRVIAVDIRKADHRDYRYDANDIRRGDRITVRGDWRRDGRFEAETIDADRGAWW
ncbi:MAG TPA: DUF5666 domain-containing protein [Thermoanaerobaculia bacterium]|nr:DUF5666 domain-containing protein [Thermoanaerobaculia bacterium]